MDEEWRWVHVDEEEKITGGREMRKGERVALVLSFP